MTRQEAKELVETLEKINSRFLSQETRELIPIMKAFGEGKTIEIHKIKYDRLTDELNFTSPTSDYKIVREPRRLWVNFYGKYCSSFTTKDEAIIHINDVSESCVEFIEVMK